MNHELRTWLLRDLCWWHFPNSKVSTLHQNKSTAVSEIYVPTLFFCVKNRRKDFNLINAATALDLHFTHCRFHDFRSGFDVALS